MATAIATLRSIRELKILEKNIKKGITKIKSIGRFQEIKTGKLKNIVKNNKLFVDGSHNPLGAKAVSNYLNKMDTNKHIIIGMMSNKNHLEYISFFKNKINSITAVDIPNQPNSIKGRDLKKKIMGFNKVNYKSSIKDALKALNLKKDDIILITGSLYLAGEVLSLN